jgi:hypothetical protein
MAIQAIKYKTKANKTRTDPGLWDVQASARVGCGGRRNKHQVALFTYAIRKATRHMDEISPHRTPPGSLGSAGGAGLAGVAGALLAAGVGATPCPLTELVLRPKKGSLQALIFHNLARSCADSHGARIPWGCRRRRHSKERGEGKWRQHQESDGSEMEESQARRGGGTYLGKGRHGKARSSAESGDEADQREGRWQW